MDKIKELEEFLRKATAENVRGNLTNQGIAWSIMRIDGHYTGTTKFLSTIETDLFEYGFSLLRAALDLKELGGDPKLINRGFELAGSSFESLTTNSEEEHPDAGFIQIIAACCYHLAGYSAIAFSILNKKDSYNINAAEKSIRFLILRDLNGLKFFVEHTISNNTSNDESISDSILNNTASYDDAVASIANISICRALAFFDFALQTGNEHHMESATTIIKKVISMSDTSGNVTLWWIARLCLNLINDLWAHSLHQNIPNDPPIGGEAFFEELRKQFILTLYARKTSEVELWPSQMEAAKRSTNIDDDLVVALPTSAGKTRIAEIAALVTLSTGKRIVIVTPLRALSAQTERSFKKTFAPLGYSVSSLYGAIGMSSLDQDSLNEKSIVISTPEKLDFALRNDSSLLNDVGLIILDEGHMIGPTEREIRYEILVQRLLRRSDSDKRRIVCLSAILPEGEKLNNFTQWLRSDVEGTAVRFPWRPTRQRFGTIIWQGNDATLNFEYRSDIPFINKFIEHVAAIKPERSPRPTDLNEKTIFAAWKFASQGKRTLIFVTQANWVEKFGSNAIKLVEKGYLESLLEDRAAVENAISVGEEWLGKGHPAVKALEIGMAVHHGGLPNPFLRELELLLSKGIIKVTVASPTLSQGLNINAAILLVPYLVRAGVQITGEEFANVAGRAGRAFVDMEGFVIHIIDSRITSRKEEWRSLITSARERNLSSGLFQIIDSIYEKLSAKSDLNKQASYEYLASKREAWFPEEPRMVEEDEMVVEEEEINTMEFLVEKLDATVLGLIEALESDSSELEKLLEEALKGSLWARQVATMSDTIKTVHLKILLARAKLIWANTTASSRRGHFAMGVGFDTGLELDKNAEELEELIDVADAAAIEGNVKVLTDGLIELAEKLLVLRPFLPKSTLPTGWKKVLVQWITGKEVEDIGANFMPFVEEVFSYKLIWALEALRMRRLSQGWTPTEPPGGAAACLENGVPNFMTAMLIRSGLPSRIAAIKAVSDGNGNYNNTAEMYIWLKGRQVKDLNKNPVWPTLATKHIWDRFYNEFFNDSEISWTLEKKTIKFNSAKSVDIVDGQYRVLLEHNVAKFYTPDFKRIFTLSIPFYEKYPGILNARINLSKGIITLERFGPAKFLEE